MSGRRLQDAATSGLSPGSRVIVAVARMLAGSLPLLLAAGCGSSGRSAVRTELVPFTPEQRAALQEARGARYRLRVGDTFAVDFQYQDEFDQHRITVLPDGQITMSGAEDLKALGLTVQELDSTLTARFARDYRNPELSVIFEEFGKSSVDVLGEVRHPGEYGIPPGVGGGVLQAIALAGGFAEGAAPAEVLILRVTEQGWLYRRCNLSHLEKSHLQDPAYLDLQPYDIVYVPRSAVGDWASFSENVLPGIGELGRLFWDVYAVTNLEKIGVINR